jgi:hypothetical protein
VFVFLTVFQIELKTLDMLVNYVEMAKVSGVIPCPVCVCVCVCVSSSVALDNYAPGVVLRCRVAGKNGGLGVGGSQVSCARYQHKATTPQP